jgi:NodT family efflux transporter outer membrane factor (OMF) lipoprotein
VQDIGNVQASGRIALDFFGRHQAALRAALGQQQAAAAELQAARVLVAGQVAQAWVGLARLIALRAVAAQVQAQRLAVHALVAQRVAAGLDTQVDLRVAEAPLPEASTQLAALDGQIALARHQLAALSGQAPQALQHAQPLLAALKAAPVPSRIGADLLARRADVAAARARVDAAAQGVAAARADFYPDINLAGFVGLNALGLDRLLQLPSRQLGIGPALHLPLFDGGLLRSQLQGRAAEADAAVAAYNAAVLDAAREVADASATHQSLARQQAEQARAATTADAALALARQRFEAGLGTRAPLLVAEGAVLAQRALAADLQARQLDAQVALMRALGGGWSGEGLAPPAPAVAAAPAVATAPAENRR